MEREEDTQVADVVDGEMSTEENLGEDSVNNEPAKKERDVRISKKSFFFFSLAVLIVVLLFVFRGVFIAATVDGSPISRVSVISTLEKASGKQALEALVTQRVLENAVKKEGVIVSKEELDAEVKSIDEQVVAQGGTLELALAAQGMTLENFTQQVKTQLQVEKLLGDKINVTDAEIDAFIADKKLEIPDEQLEAAKVQIGEQLKRDKTAKEGQALVESLRTAAKVSVFVSY